jgi:nitroreductase
VQFDEVVRRRRMTRHFDPQPLEPEIVDHLLAAALRAPAAGNAQGRDFVVLEGAEQTARYWETATDTDWRRRAPRYPGLSKAPVIVLPYVDPQAYADRYAEADKAATGTAPDSWPVPFWMVDAAFAVMTLLLGAEDAGLGSAFLGNFRGDAGLRAELGVPEGPVWLGAVLLGRRALPDPPTRSARRSRRSFDEAVHRNGW